MRVFLALVAVALAVPVTANTQTPLPVAAQSLEGPSSESVSEPLSPEMATRIELARELVELMGIEQQTTFLIEQLRPTLASSVIGNLASDNADPDVLGEIDTGYPGGRRAFGEHFAERFVEVFRSHFPEIMDETARYYAQNLSLEQIEATITFYRTDAGAALVELALPAQQYLSEIGRQYGVLSSLQTMQELRSEMLEDTGRSGATSNNLDAMRGGRTAAPEAEETEE